MIYTDRVRSVSSCTVPSSQRYLSVQAPPAYPAMGASTSTPLASLTPDDELDRRLALLRDRGVATLPSDSTADPQQSLGFFHLPFLTARPWWPTTKASLNVPPAALDLLLWGGDIREAVAAEYVALERQGGGVRRGAEAKDPVERGGQCSQHYLFEEGMWHSANCDACPEATRIVASLGDRLCSWGVAYFSKLAPGTKIAPRCVRLFRGRR